jgi:hypothetical protein
MASTARARAVRSFSPEQALATTKHPPSRIRDRIQDPLGPVSDLDGMRFLRICRELTTANNNSGTQMELLILPLVTFSAPF